MPELPAFHLLCDVPHIDPATLLEPALEQMLDEGRPRFSRYPPAQTDAHVQRVFVGAQADGGIVVHALVDSHLRLTASTLSRVMNVPSIDLIGPMMVRLTDLLGVLPKSRPALYRQIDELYFRRIEAIEFAVEHDDGVRPQELDRAEIVLVGVSRTSKTPLSMYLASHGWLVANVPLVDQVEPPEKLFELDRRKVFGLSIRPDRLAILRQVRVSKLGISEAPGYAGFTNIQNELAHAREIFARGGWQVLDVSSRSIEESANDILTLRRQNMREEAGD